MWRGGYGCYAHMYTCISSILNQSRSQTAPSRRKGFDTCTLRNFRDLCMYTVHVLWIPLHQSHSSHVDYHMYDYPVTLLWRTLYICIAIYMHSPCREYGSSWCIAIPKRCNTMSITWHSAVHMIYILYMCPRNRSMYMYMYIRPFPSLTLERAK